MEDTKVKDRIRERLRWLISLRWIAILGVVITALFASKISGIPLNLFPIYAIALLLSLCNLAYSLFLNYSARRISGDLFIINNRLANLQIFLDLAFLAALLHFSGGIENPFIFYFIFHMIIAGILLTRRAAFLQATFAIALFLSIVGMEYSGALHHYCLKGFIPVTLHTDLLYIYGVGFVFISTLYIAVYMASSISKILRERENSLREANVLLEEKDRIKSEYVLRVTHDIKEHLSTIQSCIEPVTNGITGPLNQKQQDLLTRAKDRARRLLIFVRALLEISRIRLSKALKMEEFMFPDAINGVLEDIKARANTRGIDFDVEMPPSAVKMKGVRLYIEEAIMNLLANSLKYTPRGGKITFRVKDTHEHIVIQIKDTGIGIPKDEIAYIFDEFYRGSNAKNLEKEGTGLGLAITKEIVELHKGKISVESEEGKGTNFSVEFPKENHG